MTAPIRVRAGACFGSVSLGAALLAAGPLHAQSLPPKTPAATPAPAHFSAAVRVSTLGIGVEGSVLVAPNIALRAGYNGYSYSRSVSSQGVQYDGKLKLSSVPVLADLYPSKTGSFHLTAGVLFNSSSVTATGKPSGSAQTYTLNGTTFSAADVGTLDGRVTFSKTSPYLGIGFGKPSGGSALQFLFDIGVVFQGKPHLTLNRSGGIVITDPTLSNIINTAIAAQRDKSQSDVNKLQYYPVVSVGFAYHF